MKIVYIELFFVNSKLKEIKLNTIRKYKNKYYFSEFDLYDTYSRKEIKHENSLGHKILSIDSINEGDYVVHRKSGIGIYRGITTIVKNGMKMDYILIQYKGNDKLYMPVEDISKLYKYSSKEGVKPTINKLNSVEWTKTKLRIKERIKNITGELLKIYKERNKAVIEPFAKDDENQIIFDSEFEYEETTDQLKAINEIKRDMDVLNEKLVEYKGMSRLNSYNVPSMICEIDKLNNQAIKVQGQIGSADTILYGLYNEVAYEFVHTDIFNRIRDSLAHGKVRIRNLDIYDIGNADIYIEDEYLGITEFKGVIKLRDILKAISHEEVLRSMLNDNVHFNKHTLKKR